MVYLGTRVCQLAGLSNPSLRLSTLGEAIAKSFFAFKENTHELLHTDEHGSKHERFGHED
jgi:hypothetical protein